MKTIPAAIDQLPGVHRIENCSKEEMTSLAMEMTHAVYPHDQVYGQFCSVQDHVDCPPEEAFEYLADVFTLQEWTYSLRDFTAMSPDGTVVATDRIGGATKIYTRAVVSRSAMTVDYHCAWDQGEQLWMIYLMRVVPARLVLGRPGCVILWTNCHHPHYDRNPFPEKAPPGRKVWVGDMWPFFYAGHKIELDNLKHILEYRHANGLPMTVGGPPMKTVSLIGAASYLPPRVVDNDFFQGDNEERAHVMFRGVRQRHHVSRDETAQGMIAHAARKLADRLNLNLQKDVDVLMTNVTCPDQPFTGCGADVGKALGCRPSWVLDLHNGGCVSFISMIAQAQALMTCHGARTALLCNVQNTGGRLFATEQTRKLKQARIPGDGCGVGYLVASDESPVRAVVQRNYCEYAGDMAVVRADGTEWWEASQACSYVDFNESKLVQIMGRANRIVPEVIHEACRLAGLPTRAIDTLITNQPNRIFLRNWREALQVPAERHVSTFERHGNLFGAALPLCLEEAIDSGQLKRGSHLVLGGFAHAGEFAAAAVIHWKPQ